MLFGGADKTSKTLISTSPPPPPMLHCQLHPDCKARVLQALRKHREQSQSSSSHAVDIQPLQTHFYTSAAISTPPGPDSLQRKKRYRQETLEYFLKQCCQFQC